ncbi:MAG: helix-turn-helix domain-containing protein [Chloroflexi bacterium]|nr:helix-turn-helix domain-containing protein [Chloroflexota bacterium]MYD49218.1 helix-turn-helix domain-containing protein [Chloroflexota bacterium]MYE67845.1 helix-turn-helix domain-containing protein [Acidimicrobiia bacterium]
MLNTVLEHHLPIAQAAEIMGISERHTKRLLAAYRKDGPAAVAHGNRGRRPHNAVPEEAAAAVVKLASNHYSGANHSHFTELLREREGIDLSRPTVRRILVKAGMGIPRSRRSQQHRFRRKRMPQEGMLIQVDGSHHPWLEDRGPKFVLLLAVDDATGVVAQSVFHPSEDTRG